MYRFDMLQVYKVLKNVTKNSIDEVFIASLPWLCVRGSVKPSHVPCLSPLDSFLKAYEADICLLQRYCPFIASIAESLASKLAKLTNAKPFDPPLSGSLII